MLYVVLAFIVGFAVAALVFRFVKPASQKIEPAPLLEAQTTDNSSALNIQYNEMISEISSLVQESLEKAKIDREIEIARSVQNTILPPASRDYDNISVSGRSYVAGSCGGDWWYHARVKDTVIVWLGDVTGHGVASALVASASRAVASSLQLTHLNHSLAEWLEIMNEVIFDMTQGEIYLTLVCAKINIATGEVEIANASHPSVFSLGSVNAPQVEILDEPLNPPIGREACRQYKTMKTTLNPQSGIFLISDGLLDIQVPKDTRWNLKGVCQYLKNSFAEKKNSVGVTEKVDELLPKAMSFGLPDDVTFVTIFRN